MLGVAKNLGVTHDYVLDELTYENMMMYNMATPSYDDEKEEEVLFDESLDANNPDNFNNEDVDV